MAGVCNLALYLVGGTNVWMFLAVCLLSGIGSTPFFAPIALKTLISKEPLEENDRLLTSIKLDKDDYHLLRYYNMLVLNRPASLFLQ